VSAVVAVAFSTLLLYDAAFVGDYVDRLLHIGEGIAAAGLVLGVVRWRWSGAGDVLEWGVAAGIALAACAVQFALYGHPMAAVGDGFFQVHRAAEVHAGRYFFTSITPKPFFEFPYPVSLYVAALPLWRFFTSEVDLVRLLRGITVVAYALAAVGWYAAARRQWGRRWPALLCVVLFPFARAPFQALANANLTNAFGEAMFGAGMAAVAWNAAGTRVSIPGALTAIGLMSVGFMSHFGTVMGGTATAVVVAFTLIAFGEGRTRRFGLVALAVIAGAALASYVVYYSHFNRVYRESYARVVQAGGQRTAGSKVIAPPAVKVRHWLGQASDDYGRPSLVVAATALAGLLLLLRRRRREALTLVLTAWAAIWVAFTVLEFLLPFELRFNLAVAPVFVCLSAYAVGTLGERSKPGAAAAVVLALLVAWHGAVVGLGCIGLL
jgi:MYXO-CTERM domain-containing protein